MKVKSYWKKHRALTFSIIALMIMLWVAHVLYQKIEKITVPKPNQPITVQTIQVKEAPMPSVLETIGLLNAQKEVKITTPQAGKVQKLLVEGGSWVNSGVLLLSLIGGPEIKAPFDGYLTDWQVKPGQFVAAGGELVDIVDTRALLLSYRVPEHFAPELDLNQAVEVTVSAFPNNQFKGNVQFISPVVDKKTHTILVKALVQNPNQNLWPGMSAHVRHIFKIMPKALVVPESCLILTMEGYELLVVSEDKLVRRKVTLGSRGQGRVAILSGVSLNETVLLTRNDATKEGTKVIPENWTGAW